MSEARLVYQAISQGANNAEQLEAIGERGHCVVLAGPGSGKTRTLATAMARTLLEDVAEPRGVACITYNNECALELEARLEKLGVESGRRVFIGTVHGFALSQVITPYARCVLPELPADFGIATGTQCREAVEAAFAEVIADAGDPLGRWRFAQEKRRKNVNRTDPVWRGRNPELAAFVEAYEAQLRRWGLIDFDDMPLLGFRVIQAHPWIARSLQARYPVLFVDEYQDLGYPLHELVLTLCFQAGIRLFAVGDPDQSIYAFAGADPSLLENLAGRPDVRTIRLRFNYRCGQKIIDASIAALGEERIYEAPEGTAAGTVLFSPIDGDEGAEAKWVVETLIPELRERGFLLERIAVLYRTANQGNWVAAAALAVGLPFVRADNQALVRRNSRLSRLVEACACWAAGGWKEANPPFRRLSREAATLVLGWDASTEERDEIQLELLTFLRACIGGAYTANSWLRAFRDELVTRWRLRARRETEDWDAIDEMISRTDPQPNDGDMSLASFGGRIEGGGRLNLSTLHSAKGREFDVVILFAMNSDVIPKWQERQRPDDLREARRLFYVGVTRARTELYVVFRKGYHSPWVRELYERLNPK